MGAKNSITRPGARDFCISSLRSIHASLLQELMVSDGEVKAFAAHASPEWFACFQTFFFKVNRQAGRMCVDPASDGCGVSLPITTATPASTMTSSVGVGNDEWSGGDSAGGGGAAAVGVMPSGGGAAVSRIGEDDAEEMVAGEIVVG